MRIGIVQHNAEASRQIRLNRRRQLLEKQVGIGYGGPGHAAVRYIDIELERVRLQPRSISRRRLKWRQQCHGLRCIQPLRQNQSTVLRLWIGRQRRLQREQIELAHHRPQHECELKLRCAAASGRAVKQRLALRCCAIFAAHNPIRRRHRNDGSAVPPNIEAAERGKLLPGTLPSAVNSVKSDPLEAEVLQIIDAEDRPHAIRIRDRVTSRVTGSGVFLRQGERQCIWIVRSSYVGCGTGCGSGGRGSEMGNCVGSLPGAEIGVPTGSRLPAAMALAAPQAPASQRRGSAAQLRGSVARSGESPAANARLQTVRTTQCRSAILQIAVRDQHLRSDNRTECNRQASIRICCHCPPYTRSAATVLSADRWPSSSAPPRFPVSGISWSCCDGFAARYAVTSGGSTLASVSVIVA